MPASGIAPGFRVDQIDHVEIFVPDRHEAARWYAEILGLEILADYEGWAEDPHGPLMISSDGGSTMLALFAGEPQGSRATAGFHRTAFRVGSEGFLEFLERLDTLELKDHGGESVKAFMASDHGRAFSIYFCDPWGHRLELTTYEPEPVRKLLARRS